MKRLFGFVLLVVFLVGCSQRTGHLVGVQGRRPYHPEIPLGMVYIPSGGYNMGQSDQDVPFMHQTKSKTVSVQAFYIDQTEISNNEYRQFVYWVRDSIARNTIFDNLDDDEIKLEIFKEPNTYWLLEDEQEIEDPDWVRENSVLDWDWRFSYSDPEFAPLLTEMYLQDGEDWYNERQIDVRKLMFEYYWIDLVEAAKRGRINIVRNGYDKDGNKISQEHRTLKNPPHPFTEEPVGREGDLGHFNKKGQNNAIRTHEDRSRFIIQEKINVYPDTLTWIRDFTYSFNDPMTKNYFWHPAYDNYPVVGITWVQAKAFCVWRTQLLNNWLKENGQLKVNDFRLPTEAEWERAARGDLDLSAYPWGGPYIRNSSGCFLGNFKPMRGRYFDDGGFHTVKVYSYNPNGWGLYCMAGNVSEWCETAYDESVYEFSHDLNTEYRYWAMDWDPPSMKRKVIRGGSWKDVGFYLQTGSRTYEYQDTAKCYIGFRCVMTHLGRGGRDFEKEGGEVLKSDIQLN